MIYKQQEHLPFTAWLSTNRQEGFYWGRKQYARTDNEK